MKALKFVLWFKIVITVVLWTVIPLTIPVSLLEWLGIPDPEPVTFLRLLGAAYAALLLGYVLALLELKPGKNIRDNDIRNAVWVGIVSNGGASLVLAFFSITGAWSRWGVPAQLYMWVSNLLAAVITLLLVWAYYLRNEAQQKTVTAP